MNKEQFCAYAAGWIETDGSIHKLKDGRWRVTIGQSERNGCRPLQMFQEQWGGTLNQAKKTKMWRWQIAELDSAICLHQILPYMHLERKKAIAEEALGELMRQPRIAKYLRAAWA